MATRLQRPLWQDAYDAQMGLWRWYRTPQAEQWLGGLFKDSAAGVPHEFRQRMLKQYDAETGRLVECDPFYVAEEMVELVDAARRDFKPEPLQEWDLLTPRGFLYYARPITVGDKKGRPLPIRAVAWSQEYITVEDGDEGRRKVEEYLNSLPEKALEGRFVSTELEKLAADGIIEANGLQVGLYSDRDEYIEINASAHNENFDEGYEKSKANMQQMTAGTPLVPVHIAPWVYGMSFDGNEVDIYGDPTGAKDWWQLIQTTFRLMLQRRPHASFVRPHRSARRDWERHGGRPDTDVVIVRLRREAAPRPEDREETEGEGRKLTHRHYRTGHWRNQWYPSIQQHRQIRIMPTIVGDDSLPLMVRPRRVFQWQR